MANPSPNRLAALESKLDRVASQLERLCGNIEAERAGLKQYQENMADAICRVETCLDGEGGANGMRADIALMKAQLAAMGPDLPGRVKMLEIDLKRLVKGLVALGTTAAFVAERVWDWVSSHR